MGIIFKNGIPKISGNVKLDVATPTYSGLKSTDLNDSINPYTSTGPGAGGIGLTEADINVLRGEVAAAATDPDFANVSLLLQGEDFIDASPAANVVNQFGTIDIGTEQSIFGSSFKFQTASTNRFEIATNPGFFFGTNQFTIEFWYYASTRGTQPPLMGNWVTAAATNWGIWHDVFSANQQIAFLVAANSTSVPVVTSGEILPLGVWHHIAIARDAADTTRLFIGGIEKDSKVAAAYNITAGSLDLNIGLQSNATGRFINGFMDDIRITNNVARYTANFTPPTEAFPSS